MNLEDVLNTDIMRIGLPVKDKADAVVRLAGLLFEHGYIDDVDGFVADVFAREQEGVTGIGEGLAIPHGKSSSVSVPGIAIATLASPIAWETLDGEPVDTVFLFAVGNDVRAARVHLALIAQVAAKLADSERLARLRRVETTTEIVRILCER